MIVRIFFLLMLPVATSAQLSKSGAIVDLVTGEPVQHATLILKGTKKGTKTNEEGRFSFKRTNAARNGKIVISAIGYETITVNTADLTQLIFLRPMADELDPVVVTGFPPIRCRISVETMPRLAKGENEIDQWLSGTVRCPAAGVTAYTKKDPVTKQLQKSTVKVYPNPIVAGNSFTAAIQLKDRDECHIDLIDAGGRVVWGKKLNIPSTHYNLSIPTESTLSAGVYFLRITGKQSQKLYNGQVVVQ